MLNIRFLIVFIGVYLYSSSLNCQENSIRYNDTITKKFYNLKKDYSKRILSLLFTLFKYILGILKKQIQYLKILEKIIKKLNQI